MNPVVLVAQKNSPVTVKNSAAWISNPSAMIRPMAWLDIMLAAISSLP